MRRWRGFVDTCPHPSPKQGHVGRESAAGCDQNQNVNQLRRSFRFLTPRGFGLVIEMQLDPTSLKLPQHILDSPLDRRIVRAVASDEFLDNSLERRWR